MAGKKWTEKEISILREEYESGDLSELLLTRSMRSIYQKALQIGIKRKVNRGGENLLKYGVKTRFKKGHVPANKGKKWSDYMTKESQKKVRKTLFQKGNIPHTAKHNGKPYLVQRVRKNGNIERVWFIHKYGGKRKPYLRYLFEKNVGKIPKGHIVTWKDEPVYDRTPTLDDVKIISRKRNLERNSGRDDLTEKYVIDQLKKSGIETPTKELIELKRNYLQIQRKLKNETD